MKKAILAFSVLVSSISFGQSYFQQEVNYKIDDRAKIISIGEPTDIVSIVKKPVAFINKARKIKSVDIVSQEK